MTPLPFLIICFGASALAVLSRPRPWLSLGIGLVGLVGALVAALVLEPGRQLVVGGDTLITTDYLRLYLVFGASAALILCLIGLATSWQRNAPAAMLAALGAIAAALSVDVPMAAVGAALGAGLVGILVTVVAPITPQRVSVAARDFRALGLAGALALVATASIARPLAAPTFDPGLVGLAYLGMCLAVAIRFGAVPFHVWAARLTDSAPEIALPLLLAWVPAALAVVGLAWTSGSVAPLGLPLDTERGLVAGVGALSLLLGSFAAWIQDDVEHVVGYSIVQDAGFVVLALAAAQPDAAVLGRTWILIFVVVKSAFAGWALALRSAFGTRRIDELGGWARRAPLLAGALALVVVGTVGLPGLTSFAVRGRLIDLAIDGPMRPVLTIGALSSLVYYYRLFRIGLAVPGSAVANGADERLRRPVEPSTTSAPATGRWADRRASVTSTIGQARAAWALNRAPIAASLVLVLSVLGFAVSAGAFGGPSAATTAGVLGPGGAVPSGGGGVARGLGSPRFQFGAAGYIRLGSIVRPDPDALKCRPGWAAVSRPGPGPSDRCRARTRPAPPA